MGAPTVAVRRALVQAGDKGALHVGAQQNTGTWLGICGRQVRGRDIRVWEGISAQLHGETHEEDFCPDCADVVLAISAALEAAAR
jgi:hypothetical protein